MNKQQLRILILSTQSRTDNTGVRVYCDSLEQGLIASGACYVGRLSHHDAPNLLKSVATLGIKGCRLLGRGAQQVAQRWAYAFLTWGVLRKCRGQFDVVLAQDPITGAVAQQMKFRTWAICHFSDPILEIYRAIPLGVFARAFIRRTMLFFVRKNTHFLVLSGTAMQMMRGYAPSVIIRVIPTICRIPDFLEPVEHDGFRIAMMGRLEPLKGQVRLIEMLPYLKDLPLKVWLIGDGPDRAMLETRAEMLGVSDRVRFWGFVKEPETLLRQCDLYIHTSHMEAFSLAPIEAIFSGLPSWMFEIPGCNDGGIFGDTGVFSQDTTAVELAKRVCHFFNLLRDQRRYIYAKQKRSAMLYRKRESIERLLVLIGAK